MYKEITQGIEITVEPSYLPQHSSPENSEFLFAYKVTIRNLSDTPAQLKSRHWGITDDHGEVEEVKGPGVVGEQPHLSPGESFEYSSFCPLKTPMGTMRGAYQMVDESGNPFEVTIPLFYLRNIDQLH